MTTRPILYREGKIFTGLCVIEYLLADEGPGDGGISVIAGSHKAKRDLPGQDAPMGTVPGIRDRDKRQRRATPSFFSEACTHGTLPWNADHQRRAILYKYNTGHMAWGRRRSARPTSVLLGTSLTAPQQAALLLPSHHSRRPKPSNGYAGLAEVADSV